MQAVCMQNAYVLTLIKHYRRSISVFLWNIACTLAVLMAICLCGLWVSEDFSAEPY